MQLEEVKSRATIQLVLSIITLFAGGWLFVVERMPLIGFVVSACGGIGVGLNWRLGRPKD